MAAPRPESTVGALLTILPPCTQCGLRFYQRACGPAHALIADNPLRHRQFAELLDPIIDRASDTERAGGAG